VEKPKLEDLKKAGQQRAYIAVPGYDIDEVIPREERAAEQARENIFREEAHRFSIPDTQLDRYLSARRQQVREWPRAADLESPAPRGHYLREFGQSDRDMIENASLDASMPQALVLMNSELSGSVLKPFTQLRLNCERAQNPEEQVTAIYLTLLAREPSAAEREAWTKARRSGLDSIDDLVFALMNTQQFIFVQ
jgi:hypothetical protein